jgi:hypothetical protein
VLALTKRSAKAFKLNGGGRTGKKPVVLIGQRKALGMAVSEQQDQEQIFGAAGAASGNSPRIYGFSRKT